MKVYFQLDELPQFNNTVLTIGSFDGVHHGHQQLLARINRLAKEVNGQSLVITFHPHPRHVLYPDDKSLGLLTTIEEKVALFEKYDVDHVVVVPFTLDFSRQDADEYIQDFLLDLFNPSWIVIGYDHKFGRGRIGDINYLKKYANNLDFEVVEIAPQEIDDIAVSSTKIRRALQNGKLLEANDALGYEYKLSGTVIRGQQLGRQLGYPTANIEPGDQYKLIPKYGIYAARVVHNELTYLGMLYIGDRPSIDGLSERTIEVNIFDFDQEIYDDQILIEFVDFIREDAHFDTLKELSDQLENDKEAALAILNNYQPKVSI